MNLFKNVQKHLTYMTIGILTSILCISLTNAGEEEGGSAYIPNGSKSKEPIKAIISKLPSSYKKTGKNHEPDNEKGRTVTITVDLLANERVRKERFTDIDRGSYWKSEDSDAANVFIYVSTGQRIDAKGIFPVQSTGEVVTDINGKKGKANSGWTWQAEGNYEIKQCTQYKAEPVFKEWEPDTARYASLANSATATPVYIDIPVNDDNSLASLSAAVREQMKIATKGKLHDALGGFGYSFNIGSAEPEYGNEICPICKCPDYIDVSILNICTSGTVLLIPEWRYASQAGDITDFFWRTFLEYVVGHENQHRDDFKEKVLGSSDFRNYTYVVQVCKGNNKYGVKFDNKKDFLAIVEYDIELDRKGTLQRLTNAMIEASRKVDAKAERERGLWEFNFPEISLTE